MQCNNTGLYKSQYFLNYPYVRGVNRIRRKLWFDLYRIISMVTNGMQADSQTSFIICSNVIQQPWHQTAGM